MKQNQIPDPGVIFRMVGEDYAGAATLPMGERELAELSLWIVEAGLAQTTDEALVAGLADRLAALGIPLLRVNMSYTTLHPTIAGRELEWWRDNASVALNLWQRESMEQTNARGDRPYPYMLKNDVAAIRADLTDPEHQARFPLFASLAEIGGTGYYGRIYRLAESQNPQVFNGVAISWVTDGPEGMTDAYVEMFERLLPYIVSAARGMATETVARGLLETYIGPDAGRRVFGGTVTRGDAETIRAVIWFADMRGFTKIADTLPPDQLMALLNRYFEVMVDIVIAHGGDVLKFLGDGLLAIFRDADGGPACKPALAAAHELQGALAKLDAEQAAAGLPLAGFRVALHVGELLYGNIGGRDRLDFTVLGPAVNEASRMNALAKSLEQDVIVSSAFAQVCDRADACQVAGGLVSLGRYALRGVGAPQHLYTLDTSGDVEADPGRGHQEGDQEGDQEGGG